MIEYEEDPTDEPVLYLRDLETETDADLVMTSPATSPTTPRTDSILYTITDFSRDTSGLINTGPAAVMTEYVWGGNQINPAGSFFIPGTTIAATTAEVLPGQLATPDTDMLDNFSPGTMGIYVERFDGNAQYPAVLEADHPLGNITLFTPLDSSGVTPPNIIAQLGGSNPLVSDSSVQYSNDEVIGLEAKYGSLPTGVSIADRIGEVFYNLGVELVATYTARTPAGHKIHNYKTLFYNDLISITSVEALEAVKMDAVSSVISTQEREQAPSIQGFTGYSTQY